MPSAGVVCCLIVGCRLCCAAGKCFVLVDGECFALVAYSLLLLLGAAGLVPVAACCRRIFCLRRIAARDCGRASAKSRRTCRALAYTSASHDSSAYPLAGRRSLQARSALYSVCLAAFDFLELPAPGSATKSEPRSARTSAR